METKKKNSLEKVRWFILGIALTISLFQIIFLVSIREENHWSEHSRCYYFNDTTKCGKTIYCPNHITEERCKELGGDWLLETPEREVMERHYFEGRDNKQNDSRR